MIRAGSRTTLALLATLLVRVRHRGSTERLDELQNTRNRSGPVLLRVLSSRARKNGPMIPDESLRDAAMNMWRLMTQISARRCHRGGPAGYSHFHTHETLPRAAR